MNKQQAIEIIEREPVGGAQFYVPRTDAFYMKVSGALFEFSGSWVKPCLYITRESEMIPMHEILEIALGED